MTFGQQLALEDLQRIVARTSAVEILAVRPPSATSQILQVDVSIYCADMPLKPGGLPLRDRERMTIWIPPDFPYAHPSLSVAHLRFAGYPHVQWGRWPCLYQAPQTEWSVSARMFGFLQRLEMWLRHAAAGELDPADGPLHPPVTYNADGPLFIPRTNAPATGAERWLGYAGLRTPGDHRIDLVEWAESTEALRTDLAGAAILLDKPMPFEFPTKFGDLLRCLHERGVPLDNVFGLLRTARARNGQDQPLYVVLGTPMRRLAGGSLRQHLTAWRLEPFAVDVLDLDGKIGLLQSQWEQLRDQGGAEHVDACVQLRLNVVNLFQGWADGTSLTWCRLREDRPEVTMRRDTGRPATAFAGKAVELWGCGALGGYVAECLVRAGVKRLILRDEAVVTPGVLVRQPYVDADIGRAKARALAERLSAIYSACEITPLVEDVLDGALAAQQPPWNVDLVIDATASNLVLTKLEELWKREPARRCLIASISIDRSAVKLLAVLVKQEHSGGPLDVVRRMKLVACQDPGSRPYLDAFFPASAPQPFQPEPGCSDATFIGSAADAAHLATAALNYLGAAWQRDTTATALGSYISSACTAGAGATVDREFASDYVFTDVQNGYETRIDQAAWRTLTTCKEESRRRRDPDVETGGLLFGEQDEHLKVIWVSEASGPPPDSRHSAEEFICGIEGTSELNAEKTTRTRQSVQYVGTWHTHPVSAAVPSGRDFGAMSMLLTQSPAPIERLLLLILGQGIRAAEVTASVFLRSEFEQLQRTGYLARVVQAHSVTPVIAAPRPQVGIALSGGGSRAIAFHLGCLRALHDLGILMQTDVISTVSGGSVIGALYAYTDGSFPAFDARVCAELRRGFIGSLARRTLLSPRILQILGTKLISGVAANASFIARFLIGNAERLLPRESKGKGLHAERIQPPFRRWVSRTQAFEQTLRDRLFGRQTVSGVRRGHVQIVMNACELRTGTAFRFGSRESGNWRYGLINDNNVEVATAVAASAAYPALLPAIDRYFTFVEQDGQSRRKRVILTDGGVYENLGVSCMTPDRDASFSTNVFHPPYLICCDAGPGQFDDVVLPYGWTTRMRRAFETTFRQTQHGLQKQLHLWRQHGDLKGFVYSYLGQQDGRLPLIPVDLIRREEIVHYPTDFSPMSPKDIDLLSRRGEQLTRLLVQYYCPEL